VPPAWHDRGVTEPRPRDAPLRSRPRFHVRRAVRADLPVILDLRLAFDRELLGGDLPPDRVGPHRSQVADYLATHVEGDTYRLWVVQDGGRIVGMGGLVVVDRPPHPRSRRTGEGFIVNVYTLPRWRGSGVGRAVMDALVADARTLRLRRVYLRTSDAGRPLYEGMGFLDPGNYLSLDLD
jgi:GNAT superfamily N-acetyltransferase